ncbi:MAG TPA: TlyA family RNA methyltransferase [Elusimicrobiota bacterium]|nr:TlyA family RNA methyltransferase [Elusimicrobiota bacterium]
MTTALAPAPRKIRLDVFMVQNGLTDTRAQAQALLLAGRVLRQGHPNPKPGDLVKADEQITVTEPLRYASRGGEKLEGALTDFKVTVQGRTCLDIGASTGGFTDCLLQNGARHVVALDVGHGQIHWKLRNDPRVTVLEKSHVLKITPDQMTTWAPDIITIDVSFISLEKVLPHVAALVSHPAEWIVLVKPQFEAGPHNTVKGVVRDPAIREAVLTNIKNRLKEWGLTLRNETVSPLKGPKGNVEYFLHLQTKER